MDDRLKTGGAFDALSDRAFDIEARLGGTTLSGYQVGHMLGSGGMGYVLHATRAEGDFDRDAAIKIVRVSHDGSDFARRFRTEVQILAQLNNPTIAQLYDAGETPDGWPYLVMEYVDGEPIDTYCLNHDLSLSDRVRLMMEVVAAVQFAHTRLIVHRDLKPSNVLVDHTGKPKLLDFGIAMLLDEQAENLTQAGAMTPEFASPEQLLAQPISVATDIYQLGLLLTKVLSGHLLTEGVPLADAIQNAAEGTALRLSPSQRESLPDELVLIIEQCLRAEAGDRYPDANALYNDLHAFLSGHPVSAAGQSRAYRIRKFAQRNWGLVLTASAAVIALMSATVVTTLQMLEANRQRDIAVYEQQKSHASSEFYSLLMEEMGRSSYSSIELLDRGRELLMNQFGKDQPFMASVMFDVSQRYAGLGEQGLEIELLREAEEVARAFDNDSLLAGILCSMARANLVRAPKIAEAQLKEGTAVLDALSDAPIETVIECARAQADVLIKARNSGAALETLYQAKQQLDAYPSAGSNMHGLLLNDIASAYFYASQPAVAIRYLDEALVRLEAAGRISTLGYQRIAANKAVSLQTSGSTRAALATIAGLVDGLRDSDFQHRGAAILLTQYGDLLVSLGRPDEAGPVYREGLTLAETAGNGRIIAASNLGLAKVHLANEEFDEARERLAVAESFIHQGRPKPLAMGIRRHQIILLRLTGQLVLAREEIDRLLKDIGYPEAQPGPAVSNTIAEAVEIYHASGQHDRALALANNLVDQLTQRVTQIGNVDLGRALLQRAELHLALDQQDHAVEDLGLALPHLRDSMGNTHPLVNHAEQLQSQSSKPRNRAASSTLLRSETTAFAGKLSSGQPSATAFMIT